MTNLNVWLDRTGGALVALLIASLVTTGVALGLT